MNTQKVELKQREHLVSFVEGAKSREKKELEERDGATENAVIGKIVAESKVLSPLVKRAESFVDQIRQLDAALKSIDVQLRDAGFERDNDDGLSLRAWGVPLPMRNLVASRLEAARRPIEKSLKKYDLAIVKIWACASSEELQKATEGLF
jgi:hypothetical protein